MRVFRAKNEVAMGIELRNGVYYWRKTINGQPFNKSTKTADKKLAEQIAATWEAEAVREVVLAGSKPITLQKLAEEFLAARAGTAGLANARRHVTRFKSLNSSYIKDIHVGDVLSIIDALRVKGLKQSTLSVAVNYWNSMIAHAEERGYTPGPKVPTIKNVQSKVRWLTVEEETQLLEAINPPFYNGKSIRCDWDKQNNWDLAVTLLDLGCRYAEAADLTWTQVDMNRLQITVYRGKSKSGFKPAVLHMTQRLKEVMQRRFAEKDSEHVFPTKVGRYHESAWMKRAVKNAKLSTAQGTVTLHSLRHTFSARMLHHGVNLVELKELLGHANISTTMIYAHLVPNDATRKAVNVLDSIQR